MTHHPSRNSHLLLVGIAYTGFIILGLPSGLLGVAWPSIQATFDLPLDAAGILLFTGTVGYLLASFLSGPFISRLGLGLLLLLSGLGSAAGLLGYSLAPAWWMMVAIGFIGGLGGGALDSGLNTYFATNHSAKWMNWLHACFGIGATLGPLLMTGVLDAGLAWRWGYIIVGGLELLLTAAFALTLRKWKVGGSPAPDDTTPVKVSSRETLRLPAAWFGIALFFLFTGIEGSAGQWSYTLFTLGRAVTPAVAGMWVSIYWGSLTVGRVVLGALIDRVGVTPVLRACMAGVVIGAAGLSLRGAGAVGFIGLALIGFSLAPLFPSMTSVTPRRVGDAHAPNAIGFQVASASLGIAALPGLAGVLADKVSLETLGPFLMLAGIAVFILHEASISRRFGG